MCTSYAISKNGGYRGLTRRRDSLVFSAQYPNANGSWLLRREPGGGIFRQEEMTVALCGSSGSTAGMGRTRCTTGSPWRVGSGAPMLCFPAVVGDLAHGGSPGPSRLGPSTAAAAPGLPPVPPRLCARAGRCGHCAVECTLCPVTLCRSC